MTSPRLVYGTMRLAGPERTRALDFAALDAAFDAGIRRFDLADIYAGGNAERRFGEWLSAHPGLRPDIAITSKCGVRLPGINAASGPVRYNSDGDYLRDAVELSLERIGIDALDTLLIHRPDYLADLSDTAAALDSIVRSGRAREIGVSNFTPAGIAALARRMDHQPSAHQFELNLVATSALDDGRLLAEPGLRIEAWSPLRGVVPTIAEPTWSRARADAIGATLDTIAARLGLRPWQLALAWILRHPAGIWPVIGTTRPERIRAAVTASATVLARADWYKVLEAVRGERVP